ncbi:hypothetical protein TNCV_1532501 [Trichonephila clavipes]|nr:hypothetical protein TNCV_1532501 [Trichonephila clavipes]
MRSSVCLETFHSIFAVTLPLVRSSSWDTQLAVPNDPRYSRLVTNLGIEKARKRWKCGRGNLMTFFLCVAEHCLVEKWFLGAML